MCPLICLSSFVYLPPAVSMILGLSSFAKAFSLSTDTVTVGPAWSYSVGWLASVLSILCAVYFLVVTIYRYRNPTPKGGYQATNQSYAPLAQFESTETGSDDDDL